MTHVLKRHDEIGAILSAVTLTLLLAQHKRYRVRSDVPTLALGVARFAASLLVALAYGTLGFFLIDRRSFGVNFTFADAVNHTLRLYFSQGDAGLTPRTRYADWFLDSLSIIGVVALAYAVFSLARPVVWRRRTLPHERRRARQLIERWGDSSLDFFKWQPDKLFFFASTGRGVIAYRVALASAVALGDPLAETPEDLALTLAEFLDFCDANAWRVAFHQVPPTRLPAYRAAGLQALKIGEEAVVDLTAFNLSGKTMKHLRATVNRFEREGYRAVSYPAPLDDALLGHLRAVSDEWLTIEGRRERGFTLGAFLRRLSARHAGADGRRRRRPRGRLRQSGPGWRRRRGNQRSDAPPCRTERRDGFSVRPPVRAAARGRLYALLARPGAIRGGRACGRTRVCPNAPSISATSASTASSPTRGCTTTRTSSAPVGSHAT